GVRLGCRHGVAPPEAAMRLARWKQPTVQARSGLTRCIEGALKSTARAQRANPRMRVGRSGAHHTPFQAAQATSREPPKIMSSATQTMISRPIQVIHG